ncbi:MAG: hypothetical protein E7233_01935 [Lachnospiraceae bacterium]|nr:hypothetical protein [Lachnospiraceae bacterium]
MLEEDAWDLATIFHESCHSTGHESRLNRIGLRKVSFGSETYSKEELIAEVGAACMLSTLGMASDETICNNAAYVHGWLQALKEDRRLIVSAAGQAEKACRFILEHSSFDWSSATVASPI